MFSTIDNRVQLIGFLGQEIDVKEYQDGKKIARMSFATHHYQKNEEGRKETVTTWHNLVAHGKTAETMCRVLSKGQRLFIEGSLHYRQYMNKDNITNAIAEVVVADFKRLEIG